MRLRHDRKTIKKRETDERSVAYAKLSFKEKLSKLDENLGKGVGATKQRERLQSHIKSIKSIKSEKSKSAKPKESKESKNPKESKNRKKSKTKT